MRIRYQCNPTLGISFMGQRSFQSCITKSLAYVPNTKRITGKSFYCNKPPLSSIYSGQHKMIKRNASCCHLLAFHPNVIVWRKQTFKSYAPISVGSISIAGHAHMFWCAWQCDLVHKLVFMSEQTTYLLTMKIYLVNFPLLFYFSLRFFMHGRVQMCCFYIFATIKMSFLYIHLPYLS